MIKLTFLGDIMCDNEMSKRLLEDKKINAEETYSNMFSNLSPFLHESDYVIANLETPISLDDQQLTFKQWEFNTSIKFAEAIKNCGVNFVTTANNHCLDRGINGLHSTVDSLNRIGLLQCGINIDRKSERYQIVNIGSIKFAILSYTYGTNAFSNKQYLGFKNRKLVNLLQEQEGSVRRLWKRLFHGRLFRIYNKFESYLFPDNKNKELYEKETLQFYRKWLIKSDLRSVKKHKPDYIICCLHLGGQYNPTPTKFTKRVTNWFNRQGCDFIICNHEHVIHGIKKDNDTFVAYALGNCIGSAGVCRRPFDRGSDYSIALHFYLNETTKELEKTTFSILKTVLKGHSGFEVCPVYDLIQQNAGEEIVDINHGALEAAEEFSGHRFCSIEKEFDLL